MNTLLLIILSVILLGVIIGVIVYFVNREGYEKNKNDIQFLSSHHKFKINSKEYNEYIKYLLKCLDVWHKFAIKNDIIYTLIAGSLIGYYWDKKIVPWDDDIDLVMRKKDWKHILNLWDNGIVMKSEDNNWVKRKVQMNNNLVLLYKNKYNADWFKIKLLHLPFQTKIGGIDIGFTFMNDGKLYESMNKKKLAPGPYEYSTHKDCPVKIFNGVKTRMVKDSVGKKYLDTVYSKKWRIKKHPKLK